MIDIDAFIVRLRAAELASRSDIEQLVCLVAPIFLSEPAVLTVHPPVTVCGDSHGQLFDVLHLFEVANDPPLCRYLFLGDYVDRGYYSIELITLLLCYKLKHPTDFFLLRGNHETRNVNREYGFYLEVVAKYGSAALWTLLNDLFDNFPIAAVIDGRFFCVHGGLDPKLSYVAKVDAIPERRVEPELGSLISGMLWSDPSDTATEWLRSDRRAGYIFGPGHARVFLEQNALRRIVRSHEMVDGYKLMLDGQLLNVWSAPNYAYLCRNKAGVLVVGTDDAEDSYLVYGPMPADRRKKPDKTLLATYFAYGKN
jgi:diadenosine tetraphosphatase ApaH/serine/threonine PP2A family protein phosphatase